jgi:hypothetical protein
MEDAFHCNFDGKGPTLRQLRAVYPIATSTRSTLVQPPSFTGSAPGVLGREDEAGALGTARSETNSNRAI